MLDVFRRIIWLGLIGVKTLYINFLSASRVHIYIFISSVLTSLTLPPGSETNISYFTRSDVMLSLESGGTI